jgi:hypothetical protein
MPKVGLLKHDKTKQYDARYDANGPTEVLITELS